MIRSTTTTPPSTPQHHPHLSLKNTVQHQLNSRGNSATNNNNSNYNYLYYHNSSSSSPLGLQSAVGLPSPSNNNSSSKNNNTFGSTESPGKSSSSDYHQQQQNQNQNQNHPLGEELIKAVEARNLPKLEELIKDKKVPIDFRDSYGCTALIIAATTAFSVKSIEICQFLLSNGADVNASCNNNKQTALHYSALSGAADAVKFLVRNGALTRLRDIEGLTARELAEQCSCGMQTPSHLKIIEYLEKMEQEEMKREQQQQRQQPQMADGVEIDDDGHSSSRRKSNNSGLHQKEKQGKSSKKKTGNDHRHHRHGNFSDEDDTKFQISYISLDAPTNDNNNDVGGSSSSSNLAPFLNMIMNEGYQRAPISPVMGASVAIITSPSSHCSSPVTTSSSSATNGFMYPLTSKSPPALSRHADHRGIDSIGNKASAVEMLPTSMFQLHHHEQPPPPINPTESSFPVVSFNRGEMTNNYYYYGYSSSHAADQQCHQYNMFNNCHHNNNNFTSREEITLSPTRINASLHDSDFPSINSNHQGGESTASSINNHNNNNQQHSTTRQSIGTSNNRSETNRYDSHHGDGSDNSSSDDDDDDGNDVTNKNPVSKQQSTTITAAATKRISTGSTLTSTANDVEFEGDSSTFNNIAVVKREARKCEKRNKIKNLLIAVSLCGVCFCWAKHVHYHWYGDGALQIKTKSSNASIYHQSSTTTSSAKGSNKCPFHAIRNSWFYICDWLSLCAATTAAVTGGSAPAIITSSSSSAAFDSSSSSTTTTTITTSPSSNYFQKHVLQIVKDR